MLEHCERAAAHGFAWVAAECEELLRRSSRGEAEDDLSGGAEAHARLGTVSLAPLAMPIPAWERSLRTLEQYTYDTVNKAAGAGSTRASGARRLVWEIDTEFDDLLRDRFILGSPEDCFEQLRPYVEELGINHLLFRTHWAGMPLQDSLSSMRLISDELLPELKKLDA